jgi:Dolichyl-phosphate-mannose-protein mannosyltransferase
VAAVLLFVTGCAVFALYYVGLKGGRPSFWPDTYEYAEVARNIATGQGLRTSAVSFAELWLLGRHPLPLPYLLHDCGNSLLMAGSFLVLGVYDGAVGWGTGFAFACLPPLAFLLGSRLFGRRVGFVAALLVLVHAQLLTFAAAGLSEVPFALALTLTLLLASRARRPWLRLFTGLAYGATVAVRSNALLFLPWFMLFLALEPRKESGSAPSQPRVPGFRMLLERSVPFLVGFAIPFLPIAARNQRWLGGPLYSVTALDSAYGLDIHAAVAQNVDLHGPLHFAFAPNAHLLERMLGQIQQALQFLLDGGMPGEKSWADPVLFFFFLFGAFAPPREEARDRWFRWLLYALILTTLGVGSLVHLRWRHLYGFLPAILVYDAEMAVRLINQSSLVSARRRAFAVAAFVLLVAAFGAPRLVQDTAAPWLQAREEHRLFLKALSGFLQRETPGDAVVLIQCPTGQGDLRPALSWYADRITVEFNPYTVSHLAAMGPPRPLFVLTTFGALESEADHPSMRVRSPPDGFVPVAVWQEGATRAVLLGQAGPSRPPPSVPDYSPLSLAAPSTEKTSTADRLRLDVSSTTSMTSL